MSLRLLLAALLLANALFFGWTRGWFAPGIPGPHQGEREPQRLAAQHRPEAIRLLAPQAASEALTAARAAAAVCLQAGPFDAAAVAAAEAALAPAQVPGGSLEHPTLAPPPVWLVYAARAAEPATRRAREADLRRRGIDFDVLDAPPELAGGLVLSRHPTQAEADAALAALAASAPAPRGVRVQALPAPPPLQLLQVAHADAALQARLLALPPQALAGGFRPCATKPATRP